MCSWHGKKVNEKTGQTLHSNIQTSERTIPILEQSIDSSKKGIKARKSWVEWGDKVENASRK
jgi:phage-related tail protein